MKTYANEIARRVQEMLPNVDVSTTEIEKDNGEKLTGLSIREKDSPVGLTICVDDMFNEELFVGEAAENIVKVYAGKPNINADSLLTFDTCKNSLRVRLYGRERNHAKEETNVTFLGKHGDFVVPDGLLAEVYAEYGDTGTIAITKSLFEGWDVPLEDVISVAIENTKNTLFPHISPWGKSVEELHEVAVKNTSNLLPYKVQPMHEKMQEMFAKDGMPAEMIEMMFPALPQEQEIYIVTNFKMINGAIYMFDNKALDEVADKVGSDLYILPSSIHEVIAISANMGAPGELSQLVREVNGNEVPPEEQLSDNVYYYDRENKTVKIA